jgi:hypothetical protein
LRPKSRRRSGRSGPSRRASAPAVVAACRSSDAARTTGTPDPRPASDRSTSHRSRSRDTRTPPGRSRRSDGVAARPTASHSTFAPPSRSDRRIGARPWGLHPRGAPSPCRPRWLRPDSPSGPPMDTSSSPGTSYSGEVASRSPRREAGQGAGRSSVVAGRPRSAPLVARRRPRLGRAHRPGAGLKAGLTDADTPRRPATVIRRRRVTDRVRRDLRWSS